MYNGFDILVAKCGKSIGLKGCLKLIIYTDFIDVFKPKSIFLCNNFLLTVDSFNICKSSIKFAEINTIDDAKLLTSCNLYTTRDVTLNTCKLNDGEFFWFDLIGLNILDDGILLGYVDDIERIGNIDYLVVKTNANIFSKPSRFMIPYIDRYIASVDIGNRFIHTIDARLILETS